MIGYKKPAYRYPKGSLKQLTRLAGHGKVKSVVKFALKDHSMKGQVIAEVGKVVNKELKLLCSNKFNSILLETSQAALEYFSWESLWLELTKRIPVFLSILRACSVKRQADPERVKPVVCMCAVILAKFRNPKACLVQCIISMILQAGHASKQVSVVIWVSVP